MSTISGVKMPSSVKPNVLGQLAYKAFGARLGVVLKPWTELPLTTQQAWIWCAQAAHAASTPVVDGGK